MRFDLQGRTAIVTGGSRGIGRAVCHALAASGANVAFTYISNPGAAAQSVAEIERAGGKAIALQADATDPDAMAGVVSETEERLGPMTMLVVNAGSTRLSTHEDITLDDWKHCINQNLTSAFVSIMASKERMLVNGGGSIVCMSSIGGLRPRSRQIDYSAAKAGLVALGRNFAEALAPTIRVNSVAPGLIATDILDQLDSSTFPDRIAATPLRRMGTPEDVASSVLFLLSDASNFITGETIIVSGGSVMS